jgi:hypothetical protein
LLEKLPWRGINIAAPQMLPLALAHSVQLAVVSAVPMGMPGGIAGAANYDPAVRSCPVRLQGALKDACAGRISNFPFA